MGALVAYTRINYRKQLKPERSGKKMRKLLFSFSCVIATYRGVCVRECRSVGITSEEVVYKYMVEWLEQ